MRKTEGFQPPPVYISKVLQCWGGDQSTESKKARLEKWMSPALIIYHAYALSLAYLPVRSSCPHRMRDKVNGKAKYCQTLASLCLVLVFFQREEIMCAEQQWFILGQSGSVGPGISKADIFVSCSLRRKAYQKTGF